MPGHTWDSYYATCFSKTLEAIIEPFRGPVCSVSTRALSGGTWHGTRAHHLRLLMRRWKTRGLTWIIINCEILQSCDSKLYRIFLSFSNGLFLLSMPIATILVQASFTSSLANCMRVSHGHLFPGHPCFNRPHHIVKSMVSFQVAVLE